MKPFWRTPTTEELQAELAALPPYGSVPYHQHHARRYRRLRNVVIVTFAVELGLSAVGGSTWYLRVIYGLCLAAGALIAYQNQTYLEEHRNKAWQAETTQTLHGLQASGMFSFIEVIEAMRDAPPPPGMKRQAWVQQHEEILELLRRRQD